MLADMFIWLCEISRFPESQRTCFLHRLVSMNLHFALDILPPLALGSRPAGCQRGGYCANTHPNKKRVTGPVAPGSHYYETIQLHVVTLRPIFSSWPSQKCRKQDFKITEKNVKTTNLNIKDAFCKTWYVEGVMLISQIKSQVCSPLQPCGA